MKKISVVIPTIGRIEYLDKAIESLLNQTIPFYEIVIFDNSIEQNICELSEFTNDTKLIWKKSGKQMNPIDSWNNAINLTTGEYVTIFGDDDIAYDNFHKKAQEYLQISDFLLLGFDTINENDKILNSKVSSSELLSSEEFRYRRMLNQLKLLVPGAIYLKKYFIDSGHFQDSTLPNYLYSDDLLYFKIAILSKNVFISGDSLWQYRIHEKQIGKLDKLKEFAFKCQSYEEKLCSELIKFDQKKSKIFPKVFNKNSYIIELIITRAEIILNRLIKLNNHKNKDVLFFDILSEPNISFFKKSKILYKILIPSLKKDSKSRIKFILIRFFKILLKNNSMFFIKNFAIVNKNKCQLIEKSLITINYDFSIKFNKLNIFIQELKEKNSYFAIYGFGLIGKLITNELKNNISVIIDNHTPLDKHENIDIIPIDKIHSYKYDFIIIAVLGRELEIENLLTNEFRISSERLIFINLS